MSNISDKSSEQSKNDELDELESKLGPNPKFYLNRGGKVKEMDPEKLRKPHTVVHGNAFSRTVKSENSKDNSGGLLRNDGHRPKPLNEDELAKGGK